MDISKNLNKVIDLLFGVVLISSLLLLTNESLLIYATCPILLSLIYLVRGKASYFIVLIGSLLMGFLFTDIKPIFYNGLVLFALSIAIVILTKSKISDKYQFIIYALLTSVIFIGAYKYTMNREGLYIDKLAIMLKETMDGVQAREIPLDIYKMSLALFPAILSSISLVYSLLSLKIVRNYLSYKQVDKDFVKLNTMRISKKEFWIILGLGLISYFIAVSLSFDKRYVLANIGWIFSVLIVLNGLSVYDNVIMSRKNPISSIIQWFFIIVFAYFFTAFFFIFGLADVFLDIRKKVRRPYEQI